jgi:hypothetical protein
MFYYTISQYICRFNYLITIIQLMFDWFAAFQLHILHHHWKYYSYLERVFSDTNNDLLATFDLRNWQSEAPSYGFSCLYVYEDILNIKKILERKELYTNPSGLMSFDIWPKRTKPERFEFRVCLKITINVCIFVFIYTGNSEK